ncbi:MAG: DAK2 domain-containing protein [Chloroflexi bacterium]|nr:DAK2 domain-containing protein [Chloroflexota bacterium]
MTRVWCDGSGLRSALAAAAANLERHVDEVNALNVFPVPDGDTGSNMLTTVRGALAAADAVAGSTAGEVASAIKRGALHEARGNSGVIVSQIFGGMADGLAGKVRFNALDLAYALGKGVEQAYRAVSQPVEGTILTVIRDAAEAARTVAERDQDIETVLAAAVDAAARSVERTPSLLAVLRDAGVVDSGGQGLYRLFQGALLHLVGEAPVDGGRAGSSARLSHLVAHADDGHGYETVFFVRPNGHGPLDLDAMRGRLSSLAESVIVAGDLNEAKVHVHNERPDEILAYGLALGDLTDITVVNLDHQSRAMLDRRVDDLVGAGALAASAAIPAPADDDVAGRGLTADGRARHGGADRPAVAPTPASMWIDPRARNGTTIALAVVAVVSGEGLEKEFRDRGAAAIVRGGPSVNPSTGELLAAIDRLNAAEIIILPNNRNVILAAHQVAELATRPVHIVPTRNPIEGLEAILAVAPGLDVAANLRRMLEQSRAVRTFQVTTAVRDARLGGHKVRQGQTIVLDPDDGVVAADRDRAKAVVSALEALGRPFELVTLLYGEGVDLGDAEALAGQLGAAFPSVEVDIAHGGQPLYPYLIAVW